MQRINPNLVRMYAAAVQLQRLRMLQAMRSRMRSSGGLNFNRGNTRRRGSLLSGYGLTGVGVINNPGTGNWRDMVLYSGR